MLKLIKLLAAISIILSVAMVLVVSTVSFMIALSLATIGDSEPVGFSLTPVLIIMYPGILTLFYFFVKWIRKDSWLWNWLTMK